jgi:hypothetical protein
VLIVGHKKKRWFDVFGILFLPFIRFSIKVWNLGLNDGNISTTQPIILHFNISELLTYLFFLLGKEEKAFIFYFQFKL